jgi:two-component system sensor histidine kinase CpxA
MRSLFIRVFLVFWAASALMLLSLGAITAFTNARPLSHRWLVNTLNLYATTTTDAYLEGGPDRLNAYLKTIKADSNISVTLLKNDANLTTNAMPEGAAPLLTRAEADHQAHFSFGRPWFGVIPRTRNGETYIFVAEVPPVRMLGRFVDPGISALRLATLMLISGVLCGLLARSITQPLRTLQKTAQDIARGNLTARASPGLSNRSDEIAMLAHDFDQMADRVQSLLDQQKILLRNISHELRSPLARLNISAELIQRGEISAAARMQDDIQVLEKLISNLLILARIDASEKTSRRDEVHLGRLVQHIVKDACFEGIAHRKTVVQTGLFERYLSADTGLLHSCIENVVRNALRHTPPDSVVEVNVSETDVSATRMIVITTSDEGNGVPEDMREEIFSPFVRITSPENPKSNGSGLGLSICKSIVELYRGTITAQNLQGRGFQVRIQIPVDPSPATRA